MSNWTWNAVSTTSVPDHLWTTSDITYTTISSNTFGWYVPSYNNYKDVFVDPIWLVLPLKKELNKNIKVI